MKNKFVGKYMRLAKQVGEDLNPCFSRKIGVLIVDQTLNKIVGTGYNGPPSDVPHNDDREYLQEIVWPQLTEQEKQCSQCSSKEDFGSYANLKICPRKIVGAASGQRLELCTCCHAETNAIVSASTNLRGAYMFCWCGVPCCECTKLIIRAGIKKIYALSWGKDYSGSSRWMLAKAGIDIVENSEEYYLNLEE